MIITGTAKMFMTILIKHVTPLSHLTVSLIKEKY